VTLMRARRRASAFTAVELIMGLLITSLVTTALAGVMAAVAQGWRATEITQTGAVADNAAVARISRTLREALEVGDPATFADGSTGIMYWADDTDGDGAPKISEMATLEFNQPTKQVRRLRVNTTRYDIWSGLYDLFDGGMITSIKALIGLLFGGQPEVLTTVLADNVQSAKFTVIPAASSDELPRVEYMLVIERPVPGKTGQTQTSALYGSATLRAPAN
jgi:type II secretory pathway pseudopilin PulG